MSDELRCPVCAAPLEPDGACATCDADSDGDLVTVWVAQGDVEAQMKKGLLDDAGIPSVLAGEALRNAVGLTVDGLGEVRIRVNPGDAPRARLVLLHVPPES